ncbi:MAG: DUF2061 domain-containing protein [Rhodocyclaceae bacterium]
MAKTLTFAACHFTVAFGVAYALTGDAGVSSVLAMIEPACNTVAYYFHEKAWSRFGNNGSVHGEQPAAEHHGLSSA